STSQTAASWSSNSVCMARNWKPMSVSTSSRERLDKQASRSLRYLLIKQSVPQPETHMDYAIEARDLRKTYPGDVRALDGLDFAVERGTVFGLLGPNGAGKSTTVKILTTLTLADAGTATVAGHDVVRDPDAVRRAIGVVAQKAGVAREATGRENLRLQGQVYGMRGRALEQRIYELLDRFGLTEAADRIGRTYSGGMQRR